MDNFGKPYERRVIMFSDEKTLYQLKNDKSNRRFLTNSEIRIVSINDSNSFLNQFRILGGVLPQNNMMFVLSPFDDTTYIELSEAKNKIALDKLESTLRLCQLLGAKHIEILEVKIHDKETNQSIFTKGQYATVSGNLDSKVNELHNLKDQIELTTKFDGGKANYEEAKYFLQQKRLSGDIFLSNLLEMRNQELVSSNPLRNITRKISMTENLQKTFDMVAEINFPVGYFNFNYKSVTEEKTEILLTMKIDF